MKIKYNDLNSENLKAERVMQSSLIQLKDF